MRESGCILTLGFYADTVPFRQLKNRKNLVPYPLSKMEGGGKLRGGLTRHRVEGRCAAADGKTRRATCHMQFRLKPITPALLMFLPSAISFPVTVPGITCQME